MKKSVFIIVILSLAVNVFGQKYCGSALNLEQMQQTDTVRYQRIMTMETQLQAYLNNPIVRSIPQSTIIIPVVIHVVYNNSTQNISDAQINSQIQVLNEDFRRLNADRTSTPSAFASVAGDANIEFRLARIDPNGNSTTGITRTQTAVSGFSPTSDNVKFTGSGGRNAWNTQKYLNIWVCNFSTQGLMGYSTFPDQFVTNPNNDGVVISYKYFGVGGHTVYPGTKGRTTTHEVGHWLNLRHIWGDAHNCSATDHVDDTPNQYEHNEGCPFFPTTDACTSSSPGIMFMNYMDYTDDACMNLFTNGQIARMRALFDTQTGIRREMLTHANAITNPPPTIIGPSMLCSGASAALTVSNAPTGFTWTCSPNLTKTTSGHPTTATFVKDVSSSGSWVKIMLGSTELARKEMSSCASVTIPAQYGCDGTYHYGRIPLQSVGANGITQYGWQVSSGTIIEHPVGCLIPMDLVRIIGGSGSLYVRGYNSAGWTEWFYVGYLTSCSSGGGGGLGGLYSTTYPNPVSDVLNIEISVVADTLQTAQASKQQIPVSEVKLYNQSGTLVHSLLATDTHIQLNVADLPAGIYYLHVGKKGKTPEIKTIIINR